MKYIQEYIAKLSITDSASVRKFFINSKLYSLQKNLTRVHLWGTFASQRRQVTRVGHCGLSIKINAGIWLVGDTDTPWQWGVHWMETQFLAIFLLSKKGTATSMFNKQRVLMHGHQGWNVRHGLCHIYMIYVYTWVVYSFCLFCCLFIIVTAQFVALYKPCKPKPKFR